LERGYIRGLFPLHPALPALLSASTLLKTVSLPVSGALAHYASALVENYLAQIGSNPTLDEAFTPLRAFASSLPCASARDLERFADGLVAGSGGHFSQDFHRLAYLAYAACSFHGDLPARVLQKLAKCEQILGEGALNAAAVAELTGIALGALQAGETEIGYSALLAAVTEAQKGAQ
jgi:hypothetical protein